jgi:two-component system chemotaxis response regulator CheY
MSIDRTKKVLVVDDSGAVRKIVRKLLVQLGYETVDEASNGAEALAKIRDTDYILVISDWNMAPMNGPALLERIRAQQKFVDLPFIMMTAEAGTDKITEAKYAGVSSFIHKPFNAEALAAKIAQIKAR